MSVPMAKGPGPLAGIRVLDFTALLQGPLATQILADCGADVIKIEKRDGEWMRHWGIFMSRTHGETDAFLAFNRNKRSVAADLRDAQCRKRLLELVSRADVVVENFRPGVMDRAGLGYEAVRARNPRIIYAASSGFGRSGPYATRPGQDYLVQALTGAMWLSGRRDDPPFLFGAAIADQFTGLHLVIGILAALAHRYRTGEGQRVDVDLLSCMMAVQQQELTVYLNQGRPFVRPAENVGHPGITAPCGVYATSDGYLMLAMTPCPRLAGILGLDWLLQYDSNERMYAARDEVHRRLSAHFATATTAHWAELLAAHDVWCAPVQDYAQLEQDPQVRHKGLIWDVPYGEDGATYRTVGSPLSFSATSVGVRLPTPRAGQHTAQFESGALWQENGDA
jgi:crotonobetainyl-CoA:carnitine CoA-transferase CaiB-like acyl-CoA transferase